MRRLLGVAAFLAVFVLTWEGYKAIIWPAPNGVGLHGLSHDEADWAPAGAPVAALRARSTGEVARAVAVCAELGVPVVTRGAGTGLSGGANAVDGCLVLDLAAMNRVLKIDTDNLVAVVQPGVVITEVTLRLRPARTGAPRTVVGAFGSLVAAGAAVAACTRLGLLPAALELLDRACLRAVEDWKHLGLPADAEALR